MQSDNNKSQEVLSYFNTIAGKYDLMNTLLSFGLHHLWKNKTIHSADIKPGNTVLDICGGTADLALRASHRSGATGLVVVYDFSPEMIQVGTEKANETFGGAAVSFVCCDAQEIAAREAVADRVLIGFGLRNLQNPRKGLREIYRVLKPGGKLVCLEFSQPVNPLFRWLYDQYSRYGIPFLGKIITGSREAYSYLPDSIRAFPLPDALSAVMTEEGFTEISYTLLMNGIAAIHVGTKPLS